MMRLLRSRESTIIKFIKPYHRITITVIMPIMKEVAQRLQRLAAS